MGSPPRFLASFSPHLLSTLRLPVCCCRGNLPVGFSLAVIPCRCEGERSTRRGDGGREGRKGREGGKEVESITEGGGQIEKLAARKTRLMGRARLDELLQLVSKGSSGNHGNKCVWGGGVETEMSPT